MEESKYHVIQINNTNYFKITPKKGGVTPKRLLGIFTERRLAETKLRNYVEPEETKKTTKKKEDAKS